MAQDFDTDAFSGADYERFSSCITRQLGKLEQLLRDPDFGDGDPTLGAELELCIVGKDGQALPVNREVLQQHADAQLSLEIDRFNLEYNCSPVPARGRPFTALQLELHNALASINRTASAFDGRVLTVGILPTLTRHDLAHDALTDTPRYRALNRALQQFRHAAPFEIRIDGEDPLTLNAADITLEGANTSFQVHLRSTPREFADLYNAAQLATPVALALASNSPIFLGHALWDETRIALFKQSLDTRDFEHAPWRAPSRVGFGHGWVRDGAWELFAESVALFAPILPVCDDAEESSGGVPVLRELRMHQSTVWRWNRAIYDHSHGGHLRIEFRALPAGPTPLDMVANAAFLTGLTVGLAPRMKQLLPAIPFKLAEWNFYRAAQHGIDARLLWPSRLAPSPEERDVVEVAKELMPVAEAGLDKLGVDAEESARLLAIIAARIESRQTGARWMRKSLDRARQITPMPGALADVVEGYMQRAATGRPVHEWEELHP